MQRTKTPYLQFAVKLVLSTLVLQQAAAQDRDPLATLPPETKLVQLNLPEEVEVKSLADYVSERLQLKILYDESIADKKVTLRAPEPIPVSSLVDLLESALRMKGLALVDADVNGWKKIVDAGKLPEVAVAGDPLLTEATAGAGAVTQVFVLQHVDPTLLQTTITPFLTKPGANSIALKEQRVLIVTDYASNIARLARLIELIDRPRSDTTTKFIGLQNVDAASFAERVSGLLDARAKAEGAATDGAGVAVFPDERTNQLIIVGSASLVDEVSSYVKTLDVPLGTTTGVYSTRGVSADRLDRIARSLLDPTGAGRLYQSAVDQEGNLLIVTAPQESHERIAELVERLNSPAATAAQSRIRFHRLKHVTAEDALETLRSIELGEQLPQPGPETPPRTDGRFRVRDEQFVPGPNRPQLGPRNEPLLPPAVVEPAVEVPGVIPPPAAAIPFGAIPALAVPPIEGLVPVAQAAQVTADVNSNTLIIVADPVTQALYEELIQKIDRPRPQVLIEAKIVIIDTSDDFALGVEISGGDRTGAGRLFAFSSFGLSEVNPVSGALSIIPGLGFNGTLVDPEVADVVLRAFTRHRRAKVLSSPRVLVNDNAVGLLTSVVEVPFTSVNASQTVATTSFAGFADAGTTITVTPHISDDDRLQLDYRITLNEFQGTASSEGVPPPRQTNEIESQVTIPDGHTLIVGGLSRTGGSFTVDSIPFLENIPVLRHLVSNYTRNCQRTSLFVFLRPVVLRDDKFRDLKYFSERDIRKAEIPGDFPASVPLLLR